MRIVQLVSALLLHAGKLQLGLCCWVQLLA